MERDEVGKKHAGEWKESFLDGSRYCCGSERGET